MIDRDVIKIKQLINSVDSANVNLGLLLAKNSGNRKLWEYARNFEIKKLHEYFGFVFINNTKLYKKQNFFHNERLIPKENIKNIKSRPENITLKFEHLSYENGIYALTKHLNDDFVEIVDAKFYDNGKVNAISQNGIEFAVINGILYNFFLQKIHN